MVHNFYTAYHRPSHDDGPKIEMTSRLSRPWLHSEQIRVRQATGQARVVAGQEMETLLDFDEWPSPVPLRPPKETQTASSGAETTPKRDKALGLKLRELGQFPALV